MSVISTSAATERLSKKLQRAKLPFWVAESSGDAWGKYLIFRVRGLCVRGCGWSLKEAEQIVNEMIANRHGQA